MPVEKREQVFVSSTYLDLREERQAVIQTLLEADCIPAGMELFPASDDEKWDLIRRVIDDSDYYIVILGGRYGSLDDETGLSFTEKEFDYAVASKTPVMGFLHGSPGTIAMDKADLDPEMRERLDAFRDKVSQKMVKYWTSPADLAGAVARSLIQTRKYHPAEGWIRATKALTPEVEREIAELRATVEKLTNELDSARSQGSDGLDASDFAQGDDVHDFVTLMRYWTEEDVAANATYPAKAKWHAESYPITWDEIFSMVAPMMLDEVAESALKDELDMQAFLIRTDDPRPPEQAAKWDRIEAGTEELNAVKVQFFALGLIDHSKKRHPVNDKESYWTLTSKGRDRLMRLSAERRPDSVVLIRRP